jgi:hypothetical protein
MVLLQRPGYLEHDDPRSDRSNRCRNSFCCSVPITEEGSRVAPAIRRGLDLRLD